MAAREFEREVAREREILRQRLRRAREEARLTQQEAAALMGVAQSLISRIESGDRRVEAAELIVLARLYGKDLDFFLRRDKDVFFSLF